MLKRAEPSRVYSQPASQHPWRAMLMLFRNKSGGAAHCMSNHVCLCEMKNLQVQSLLLGQMDNRGGGIKGTPFSPMPLPRIDLIETSDFPPETNRFFLHHMIKENWHLSQDWSRLMSGVLFNYGCVRFSYKINRNNILIIILDYSFFPLIIPKNTNVTFPLIFLRWDAVLHSVCSSLHQACNFIKSVKPQEGESGKAS